MRIKTIHSFNCIARSKNYNAINVCPKIPRNTKHVYIKYSLTVNSITVESEKCEVQRTARDEISKDYRSLSLRDLINPPYQREHYVKYGTHLNRCKHLINWEQLQQSGH